MHCVWRHCSQVSVVTAFIRFLINFTKQTVTTGLILHKVRLQASGMSLLFLFSWGVWCTGITEALTETAAKAATGRFVPEEDHQCRRRPSCHDLKGKWRVGLWTCLICPCIMCHLSLPRVLLPPKFVRVTLSSRQFPITSRDFYYKKTQFKKRNCTKNLQRTQHLCACMHACKKRRRILLW